MGSLEDDYNRFTIIFAVQLPDGTYAKETPAHEHPLLWGERQHAEFYAEQLREAARSIGLEWNGRIVRQYCTPFVGDGDDAEQLLAELDSWLREQTS